MNRKKGFTLVELLVVMAIIAILASIVVPNVANYITRSRATRALAEVKGIELALTKMLSDADRGSLNNLFDPDSVNNYLLNLGNNDWTGPYVNPGDCPPPMTTTAFRNAQNLYTQCMYALLVEGRGVLTDGSIPAVFDTNAVRKLGTNYMDIGRDPWDQLYQMFPGPWPASRNVQGTNIPINPVVFRTYLQLEGDVPGSRARVDGLVQTITDPDTEEILDVSYPAPRNKVAFIYSTGANLTSGQMVYQPTFDNCTGVANASGYAGTIPFDSQDEIFYGGGDDVNNWDNNRSWERFYN